VFKFIRVKGYPLFYLAKLPNVLGMSALGVFLVLGINGLPSTISFEPRVGVQVLKLFGRVPLPVPFIVLRFTCLRAGITFGFGLKTTEV